MLALDDPVQLARGAALVRRALARRTDAAAAGDTPRAPHTRVAVSPVPPAPVTTSRTPSGAGTPSR